MLSMHRPSSVLPTRRTQRGRALAPAVADPQHIISGCESVSEDALDILPGGFQPGDMVYSKTDEPCGLRKGDVGIVMGPCSNEKLEWSEDRVSVEFEKVQLNFVYWSIEHVDSQAGAPMQEGGRPRPKKKFPPACAECNSVDAGARCQQHDTRYEEIETEQEARKK